MKTAQAVTRLIPTALLWFRSRLERGETEEAIRKELLEQTAKMKRAKKDN